MARRYAAHFVYVAGLGFIRRQVVEVGEGRVLSICPLAGEVEHTVWIPDGIIALWPSAAVADWRTELAAGASAAVIPSLPTDWQPDASASWQAYSLAPFDLISLKPVAGTRRRLLP